MSADLDLTKPSGVIALMESSKDSAEWDANCDKIKAANTRNGRPNYPSFWFSLIVQSGLADRVMAMWAVPSSSEIKISCID